MGDNRQIATSRALTINELSPDFVIRETTNTRLVARRALVKTQEDPPREGVNITLIHQRRASGSNWEDVPAEKLNSLKAGDGFRLRLNSAASLRLRECVDQLFEMSSTAGVRPGVREFVVGDASELVRVPANRKVLVEALLQQGYPEEVWKALVEKEPALITKLSHSRIHTERLKTVIEFKNALARNELEDWWQSFFETNTWILGYGLNYAILKSVSNKPGYGGMGVDGMGLRKGDLLRASQAAVKFTVLVEIKRPDTKLLKPTRYRNGAYAASDELAGGVAQVQAQCSLWENDGARTNINRATLDQKGIHTIQPKGILIVGNTNELSQSDDEVEKLDKRTSFQLFRRNIWNPEILTFDELYERARFAVVHESK